MSKLAVLSFYNGSFEQGFDNVILQLWIDKDSLPIEVVGSLPPAPKIPEIYQLWRSKYIKTGAEFRLIPNLEKNEQSVSSQNIEELAEDLYKALNSWLEAEEFISIKNRLFRLDESAEIRVIIKTENHDLRRLPWHLWKFFARHPKAEVAISDVQFDRQPRNLSISRNNPRILAILGDDTGINVERDRLELENLPDIETVFLVKPTKTQFYDYLWDEQGWDILFFAGHSKTAQSTEDGKIFINLKENVSISISSLKNTLEKKAISLGLKLAIFNSCNGLEIASELSELQIPQMIVMREPVADSVAHTFLKYFLESFSRGEPLYLAVQEAREKLQSIEDKIACASWLPVLFQNPSVSPLTWQDLFKTPKEMFNWIVMLKKDNKPLPKAKTRREVYQAGKQRTTRFQEELIKWLKEQRMLSDVEEIVPPTTFPLIMLRCTQEIARIINSHPEVDFVLPDSEDIEIIPKQT